MSNPAAFGQRFNRQMNNFIRIFKIIYHTAEIAIFQLMNNTNGTVLYVVKEKKSVLCSL